MMSTANDSTAVAPTGSVTGSGRIWFQQSFTIFLVTVTGVQQTELDRMADQDGRQPRTRKDTRKAINIHRFQEHSYIVRISFVILLPYFSIIQFPISNSVTKKVRSRHVASLQAV